MLSKKRPQEFIVDITTKLNKDIFDLVTNQLLLTAKNMEVPSKESIEEKIAELTVSVATGLKSLVKYTREYTMVKYSQLKDE